MPPPTELQALTARAASLTPTARATLCAQTVKRVARKEQELYLTGSNLMEAIVSVAGHKRAPAVAQALAEQDVVSLEWLQELTHAESMDLSEVVGLSRHEMLLLREAAVGIQARQLKKSSAPVETDDTSYALQPSGGVGLLNSFR